MKKTKVALITFSAEKEDGSRSTLQISEICSCKDKGTAELIRYKLADHYACICNPDPDSTEIMRKLVVI